MGVKNKEMKYLLIDDTSDVGKDALPFTDEQTKGIHENITGNWEQILEECKIKSTV